MADLGNEDIQRARAYWLQRNLYTDLFTLAPSSRQSVFSIRGWNPTGESTMWVELSTLGLSQIPNVRVDITADGKSHQYWADEFKPGLRPLEMGHGAIRNLSLVLTNTSTTYTASNLQLVYQVTIWRLTIADKILRGYPLTPAEDAVAQRVGLNKNPAVERGLFPIPLETVIRRSYQNRRIAPWLAYADTVANVGTSATTIYEANFGTNQIGVLLEAEVDANIADGVSLILNRDSNSSLLTLRGDCLRGGQELFVPAFRQFVLQMSGTRSVSGTVPVRLKMLTASMGTILALRTQQITASGLAAVLKGVGMANPGAAASETANLVEAGRI